MSSPLRAIISVAILGFGCLGFYLLAPPEQATRPPDKGVAPRVETQSAVEHTDGLKFEVDGVVVPFRQLDIAAQVSGRVEFKSDECRIGRAVRKDDLLIRIEQRDYEIEVKRIEEELEQADAMLDELDAEIKTANNLIASGKELMLIESRQLERSSDLFQRRVASDSELDEARRAELASRNAHQAALDQKNLLERRRVRLESARALSEANLEKARLALKRTEIRSPIDGVVVVENIEQDAYLQTGTVVLSIQDTSQLDVTCKLHMKQMHWLWQSQQDAPQAEDASHAQAYDFPETPAKIMYRMGDTTYQWDAIVNRYDGAGVDNQTRMVPCRVYVPDPLKVTSNYVGGAKNLAANPPTLMTGMFVRIEIDSAPPIPLVRVPQSAVQPGEVVWTVKDRKLVRKPIVIATSNKDYVIAYQQPDGLQAGDEIVVSPLATPVEGADVSLPGDAPPGGPGGRGPGKFGGPPGKSKGAAKPQGAAKTGGPPLEHRGALQSGMDDAKRIAKRISTKLDSLGLSLACSGETKRSLT